MYSTPTYINRIAHFIGMKIKPSLHQHHGESTKHFKLKSSLCTDHNP